MVIVINLAEINFLEIFYISKGKSKKLISFFLYTIYQVFQIFHTVPLSTLIYSFSSLIIRTLWFLPIRANSFSSSAVSWLLLGLWFAFCLNFRINLSSFLKSPFEILMSYVESLHPYGVKCLYCNWNLLFLYMVYLCICLMPFNKVLKISL